MLAAIEGSLLWKAKTDAEKEEYRLMITKPTEETKELYMFQPFLKWERLAYRLLHEHQIHIMAICAHECEDGRIVSPMPLCNSGKSMESKRIYP